MRQFELACALCNDDNPCKNFGICRRQDPILKRHGGYGYCDCLDTTNGFLCEEWPGSECRKENGSVVPDCKCNEGCELCDEWGDCRTCLDGSEVQTYRVNAIVGCCQSACDCHESCATCNPSQRNRFECKTCVDGADVVVKWRDGGGCCGEECNKCHETCLIMWCKGKRLKRLPIML